MGPSGRLRALALLAAVAGLAACTADTVGDDAPPRSPDSSSASAANDLPRTDTDALDLRCEKPGASLVAVAKTAIAPHPGPVRAATLVRAARTGTGTWYVIGIDRAYVMDDGTPAGGASRSLALTDAPTGATIIPLGDGETDKPFVASWDRVSWTGRTLSAGQRAVRKAVECLDATPGRT